VCDERLSRGAVCPLLLPTPRRHLPRGLRRHEWARSIECRVTAFQTGSSFSAPQASDNPPAIILGGGDIAVPVARSLGSAGIDVHALGTTPDPIRHSRYCAAFTDLGAGQGVQERWLEWLQHGPRGAVILPCNDDGLELVARNRQTLLELGYRPVEGRDDVMLAMLDKGRTYELARRAGLETPRSIEVRTNKDIDAAAGDSTYPCALKPLHSHLFAKRSGTDAKLLVVHDRSALESGLTRLLGLGLEMMVTEIIPGGEDQLFDYHSYIDRNGEPLFHFTARKLRQFSIHFGIACYRVGEWIPDVAEESLRFLQGAGLRGLAYVEWKRDARDGRLKLIECNHRFTPLGPLMERSGIDLPLLVYNQVVGRPGPPVDSYRRGLHLWDPEKDVRAFLAYRSRNEITLAQWLRSLLHRQTLPIFRWNDPRPTVAYCLRLFVRAARVLTGRSRISRGTPEHWKAENRQLAEP